MGVGKNHLDTLLNQVVWRQIGHVDIINPAGTADEDADDTSLPSATMDPEFPGEEKARSSWLYGLTATTVE